MTNPLPLVCDFQFPVFGQGFVALVQAKGRVLLVEENFGADPEFWIYGVQPSGISAGGEDRDSAYKAFKAAFYAVLVDFADEATSESDFEARIKAFFAQTNREQLTSWRAAVQEVRRSGLTVEGIRTEPNSATTEPEVSVMCLPEDKLRPELNPVEADCGDSYRAAA